MKLLIVCSKRFYKYIDDIKKELENNNIEVYLPNCYDKPTTEEEMWKKSEKDHQLFKAKMYKQSERLISKMDSILVLNFDKNKEEKNYIGGATFLEMYDAFRMNKKIYLYNNIPRNILYDEIHGFNPIIINKDLSKIGSELWIK